jgi:hypothetical protein
MCASFDFGEVGAARITLRASAPPAGDEFLPVEPVRVGRVELGPASVHASPLDLAEARNAPSDAGEAASSRRAVDQSERRLETAKGRNVERNARREASRVAAHFDEGRGRGGIPGGRAPAHRRLASAGPLRVGELGIRWKFFFLSQEAGCASERNRESQTRFKKEGRKEGKRSRAMTHLVSAWHL